MCPHPGRMASPPRTPRPLARDWEGGATEGWTRRIVMKNASSTGGIRAGGAKALGIRTPMKAIRAKCLDCSCGQAIEIRQCPITTCALWSYRMGHYPKPDVRQAGAP
jgi:hypothetical protein